MNVEHIQSVRFSGDMRGAETILQDEEMCSLLKSHGAEAAEGHVRKELLGAALRVDRDILPDLGAAIDDLRQRAGIDADMECFVHESPFINAGVMQSGGRFFVLLSSAAIEKLEPKELEFVIGHELGHVIYDHFKIPVPMVLNTVDRIQPKHAMGLLSWQRKAEISADRAGLLCCGSLDVAAQAMFKLLSGLSIPHLKVNPLRLGAQFDQLRQELFRQGAEELWAMSHPLSPRRMKSLNIFWESETARELLPEAKGKRTARSCDQEISELLGYMDPLSEKKGGHVDPRLQPFLTWGGLYIAACDERIDPSELKALAEVVGEHYVQEAIDSPQNAEFYHQKFHEAREQRSGPLSAMDVNAVLTCLAAVARADGDVDPRELEAMYSLAGDLGVSASYVDVLVNEFQPERSGA